MASFGENLRRERELRGISLREIAAATKISVRFLQALELDRVDVLPGGLFPRAFVRQYARYLGLDQERLVADFLYVHGDQAVEKKPPPPRRRTPPRGLLFVGAVAIAAAALSLRKGASDHGGRVSPPPTAATGVVLPADRVYPPPANPGPPGPPTESLVLTLTAQQNCWVQVQADGQIVIDRVLSQGESETLEAHGELVLSVGNAGGLAFRVNDRPGMPLGKSGEVRRNIVITRKNLPSLVEDAPGGHASHSS